MTKLEIIEETKNFYNLNNRALSPNGGCAYRNEYGKKCALGRCINQANIDAYATYGGFANALNTKVGGLDNILKPEYHGHEASFWSDLQSLHDYEGYWTETGISESGEQKVEALKQFWKD